LKEKTRESGALSSKKGAKNKPQEGGLSGDPSLPKKNGSED